MLDAARRQRHARHLLLAEIGEAGQARLEATCVRLTADADPRALTVARAYLERAGVSVMAANHPGSLLEGAVASAATIQALAGSPELEEAAAALAGAFAAVEVIKAALGVGIPASLPTSFALGRTERA